MRTTLDIEDDVLLAAKELAKARKITAGELISQLVRKALTGGTEPVEGTGPSGAVLTEGWYVLPNRGGVVTNELVERLIERADLEDAGLAPDDD